MRSWTPASIRTMSIPTGKLPQHEVMHDNSTLFEQRLQFPISGAEELNPDGAIRQDHLTCALRRRTDLSPAIVPPRDARRCAAARSMRAASPACTKAVFSRIPVIWRACSTRSSFKSSVVLIGRLWRGSSVTAGPFPCNPLSNCACGFPAHSLTMILVMWLAPDSARSRHILNAGQRLAGQGSPNRIRTEYPFG